MANNRDWLPGSRQGQLDMARTWISVFTEEIPGPQGTPVKKYIAWGVPQDAFMQLGTVFATAQADLALAVKEETRTAVVNQNVRDSFAALINLMRDIKKRYYFVPPLTNGDLVSLGLNVPDTIRTEVNPPTAQAGADITRPGEGLLLLHLKQLAGTINDSRAEYGCRVYWGIMPPGGATIEQATGPNHYLMKVPDNTTVLPNSVFTRRKTHLFEFTGDSGSTAYFRIRYENGKGNSGPWGPMFSAVVP